MKRKTEKRSLFFDDWQACLRAHYIHVIRADDRVTEVTLRQVLLQSGLNEDDLEGLREQAYALDAPVGGELLESSSQAEVPAEIPAAEAVESPPLAEEAGSETAEVVYDELGMVIEPEIVEDIPEDEDLPTEEPTGDEEPPADFGRQLSLF